MNSCDLCSRDIFVDVLRTCQCVEEQVSQAGNDYPVAGQVTCTTIGHIDNEVLDERQNTTTVVDVDGYGFSVVNTPLTDETALTVTKKWEHPMDDNSFYEKQQVTFLLLANGMDTNRKETVNLQNNWTVTFSGLPYFDENGEPYVYTVVELWEDPDWIPVLGDVQSSGGDNPTYSITVINVYRWTNAVVLPSTGGTGTIWLITIGSLLAIGFAVFLITHKKMSVYRD